MVGHGIVSADFPPDGADGSRGGAPGSAFTQSRPNVVRNRHSSSGPAVMFVAEGAPPMPVTGGFAAGRSGKELAEFMVSQGYESARPSGWVLSDGSKTRPLVPMWRGLR